MYNPIHTIMRKSERRGEEMSHLQSSLLERTSAGGEPAAPRPRIAGLVGVNAAGLLSVVGGLGAYSWVSLYFILICTLMTLGKQMMSGPNKLESIWSSVLLTNALSLPMLLAFSSVRGEFENIGEAVAETSAAPAPPITARRVGPVDWPIWRPMVDERRNIMIAGTTRSTARSTKRAQSSEADEMNDLRRARREVQATHRRAAPLL